MFISVVVEIGFWNLVEDYNWLSSGQERKKAELFLALPF
jgi:hypothetical protein